MKPLVRHAALSNYVDLSRSLGLDPRALMRQAGLDPVGLTAQDRWVSGDAVVRLLARSAAATRREDFGLLLAERRRFAHLGPISLVLREEPDVRSALALLVRHERMYNEMLRGRLTEANGLATVRVALELGDSHDARQALELAVGTFIGFLREFLGPRWQPVSVCFTHAAPRDPATHRRLLGPVVEFDREFTGIVLYAAELDTPNRLADPLLRDYARQYLDSLAVTPDTGELDRVRALIEALLPSGRCSVEHVAASLGVDRRTVHRHLAAAGHTFSGLVNATRVQLAEQLVANPSRSLTEISGLLGFAAPSAFSRWFREQFATTARDWRTRRTAAQDTARPACPEPASPVSPAVKRHR
jgi:AraC-like DNA-binding protein